MKRQVWIYLAVTTIAVACWAVSQVFYFEFSDSERVYCDQNAPADAANFSFFRGTPCRLKLGLIVSIYGPLYLFALLLAHAPAYAYMLIQPWKQSIASTLRAWFPARGAALPRGDIFKIDRLSRLLLVIYFYATALLVFAFAVYVYSVYLAHNSSATYCMYTKWLEPHNFFVQNEPCRIEFWETARFGIFFLVATAVVHTPAYLYTLFYVLLRYLKLRRKMRLRATTV